MERERRENMFTRVYVRRTTAVLSSGKWNKQSTSHYISPQWLDETRQALTAPPPHASVSRVRGLNVQTQMECRGEAAPGRLRWWRLVWTVGGSLFRPAFLLACGCVAASWAAGASA